MLYKGVPQTKKLIYKELSYKLIGVLFEVYNEMGFGYREKYYEEAVAKFFARDGLVFRRQLPYKLVVGGEEIGIK